MQVAFGGFVADRSPLPARTHHNAELRPTKFRLRPSERFWTHNRYGRSVLSKTPLAHSLLSRSAGHQSSLPGLGGHESDASTPQKPGCLVTPGGPGLHATRDALFTTCVATETPEAFAPKITHRWTSRVWATAGGRSMSTGSNKASPRNHSRQSNLGDITNGMDFFFDFGRFPPLLALSVVLFLLVGWRVKKSHGSAHLPPSPPSDPIIGHYRIFPRSYQAEVFFEWSKTYGDIFYLEILGRKIVIVNNYDMANELMDKRSANYSDRPVFPLFMNLGWGISVTFLRYGAQFFKQRRILQQYLAKTEVPRFRPIHTDEARKMLKNLLDRPADFDWLVRRYGAAVIMKIAYGHEIERDDDEHIKMTENVSLAHVDAGDPGTAPVDFFPVLQYLPWWFPGCWFNRVVHNWSWAIKKFHDYPFEQVQRKMAEGHAPPSFLLTYLEEFSKPDYTGEHSLDDLKHATGAIYAGGAETTYSTINTFILAMVLHPEVLKKAHEEIDRVVGPKRLPDFDDRENLPYIEAVFQEVLRWRPVVPLGIPHSTMEDDTFNGMFIPKGTMVFANAWSMAMDTRIYHDPELFKPERFLPGAHGAPEQFPHASFGFGRRICPGRFLGMNSVWMAIVSLAATMDICKARGPDGEEITPKGEYTSGLSSFPKPFLADIHPRSEEARRLVMSHV